MVATRIKPLASGSGISTGSDTSKTYAVADAAASLQAPNKDSRGVSAAGPGMAPQHVGPQGFGDADAGEQFLLLSILHPGRPPSGQPSRCDERPRNNTSSGVLSRAGFNQGYTD